MVPTFLPARSSAATSSPSVIIAVASVMCGGANPMNSRRSGVSPVMNSTSTLPARTASSAPGQSGLGTTAKSVPMSLSNSALYAADRPAISPFSSVNSNGGQ